LYNEVQQQPAVGSHLLFYGSLEIVMTDEVLAPIIAFGILVALALWVPTLHLCDGCVRRLAARREQLSFGRATQRGGLRKAAVLDRGEFD
jgi:hypothetical protein